MEQKIYHYEAVRLSFWLGVLVICAVWVVGFYFMRDWAQQQFQADPSIYWEESYESTLLRGMLTWPEGEFSWWLYFCWGLIPGGVLLMSFLLPALATREIVVSERGLSFRRRSGKEVATITEVTEIIKLRSGVQINGLNEKGKKVMRVIEKGGLGKDEYEDFKEQAQRLIRGEGSPSG